jgi:hypothetical protein
MPERPDMPSSSSSAPNTATNTLAFIGIGGNSGMMMRFGNSMPKPSSSPNSAPDAPTVGTGEPISAVHSSWTAAADNTLASRNCQ